MLQWKIEALPILEHYAETADLVPGVEIGDSRKEKLREFMLLHRRCGVNN